MHQELCSPSATVARPRARQTGRRACVAASRAVCTSARRLGGSGPNAGEAPARRNDEAMNAP
eukprot:6199579-Pleurochrysis_carterae.AAC.4